MHYLSCEQEFAMVDVKTEGKERETDDLKTKLQEEGKLFQYARQRSFDKSFLILRFHSARSNLHE